MSLPIQVAAQNVTDLGELALGQKINEQFYLPGVTNGWSVSGLPPGLKYTSKLLKNTKKKGKKVVGVGGWVQVTDHDKVQLWAGGPYWATTNIGAERPEDYGLYFWWGDTVGYKWENGQWVASDGSSSGFSFSADNTQIQTFTRTLLRVVS